MTTQYTPTLKLALPITGELFGTWGDIVNNNITSMVEQAVTGLATIDTWAANSHTLTVANGTTSESRCAMLDVATGAGGTAITGTGEIICPTASKLYVVRNKTAFVVTLKTAAGTGVAVAAGNTAFLFCDGTNVAACVTTIIDGRVTGNLTVDGNTTLGNATSDVITATARFNTDLLPSSDNARDLGASANAWKDLYIDGTAYLALVDINGGTIDGTVIGGAAAAAGSFTTLSVTTDLTLNRPGVGSTISSTDALTIGFATGKSLTFTGGGSQLMKLDASGNLGVGVVPSAWGSTWKASQIGLGGSMFGRTNDNNRVGLAANAYHDGSVYRRIGDGVATIYDQDDAQHFWYTASTGAANATIGFTQAMTLDASGNLLVGTTSGAAPITVRTKSASGAWTAVRMLDGVGGANYWDIGAVNGATNVDLIFSHSGTARMTLDASGNLGVGVTGRNNNTFQRNIDTATQVATFISATATTSNQYGVDVRLNGDPNNASNYFYVGVGNATIRFIVYSNGNVSNTNGVYGAISDLKLKENITDATPKLAGLMQVRVVNYNLKTDPLHKQIGVIAQELEQVFPGLVDESHDHIEVTKTREVEVPEVPAVEAVIDDEGNVVTEAIEAISATTRTEEYTEREATGEVTKSVKYSVFVPMLIKAIQEQQAQIEALTARITALEAA